MQLPTPVTAGRTPLSPRQTAAPPGRRIAVLAVLVMAAIVALLGGSGAGPASAASVNPVFKDGNPTCAELIPGMSELKIEPVGDGTFTNGELTVTIDVRSTASGPVFDWTSNIGVDAVFVKGGSGGNLYQYDPPSEATSDTGLHAPVNPANGTFFGLSHLSFCYDRELDVTKTAETEFTRTHKWKIDKSVTPAEWDLFTGDSGTSKYTVKVDKDGFVDSGWSVSGTITVKNPWGSAATVTGVTDLISGVGAAPVDCGVTFPYALGAGQTLTCTYETALPDGTDRTNTATAATTGAIGGDSGTADVKFGNPTTVVNDTVHVTDSVQGNLGVFTDGQSKTYDRTFTCNGDKGEHPNTATIDETGDKDSATVTVRCHGLTVKKTADTALTRTWKWTIDKSADQSSLLLSPGQLFLVNYTVKVDATSTDSGHAVSGKITVTNGHPSKDATLTAVSDVVSPAITGDVDCPTLVVPAGGSIECTYSADLPNAADRTNTATATLQNTPSGTTDFTGTAAVSFANATVTKVDDCINVTDTNVALGLGTVCAADAPKTFSYGRTFGQHPDADVPLVCGPNKHDNIAAFKTDDTGATGSDTWTVNATVECAKGCTLTQGYWKTHSDRGPAPYDDAWKNLGGAEEDTVFFLSGKTWYQVFWTAPAGNAYYNLAHQYMAAKLNILNGASTTPAVDQAITAAEAFFNSKTPGSTLTRAERNTVLALTTTLDQYNNGLIGPGHCSE